MPPQWVLVVDDDEITRMLLSEWFEQRGFRVTTADDAMQAVIQARDLKPVLIVTDLMMPVWGTGADAIRQLRIEPATKSTPIIMVTGLPPAKAEPMIPKDALLRVVYKPIDLETLAKTVRELTGYKLPDPKPAK